MTKNKKQLLLTFILFLTIPFYSFSQKQNINSAAIIFKQFEKSNDLEKLIEAKEYIDKAKANESTANSAKMWNYRAPIYLRLAEKAPELDKDAILKATEAYIQCLQVDKKGRVVVRKWSRKDDLLTGIVQCGSKLFNEGVESYNRGEYERAISYYNKVYEVLPFDEENQLKRKNITTDVLKHYSFFSAKKMGDFVTSKKLLQDLIDNNFNNPDIYREMSSIYKSEGDIDKAIEYIELGREMFSDDQALITTEINLYIELNRTDELIQKITEAIEEDPENDIYYLIRATCLQNSNKSKDAISDYEKVLDLNPNNSDALNNIASCYLEQTEPIIKKKNALSYHDVKKNKLYEKQLEDLYKKTLPYLERYVELNSESKANMQVLSELYYKLEMYSELKALKQKMNNL